MTEYHDVSADLPRYATDHDLRVASISFWSDELDAGLVALSHEKDPALCRPEILPWLAYEASADFWEPTWPVATQRAAVAAQWDIHRYKGTPFALRRALALFGVDIEIIEWWQTDPPGEPGTFKLRYSASGFEHLQPETVESLQRAIELTKPMSRHHTLEAVYPIKCPIFLGVASMMQQHITILPFIPKQPVQVAKLRLAVGHAVQAFILALPKE